MEIPDEASDVSLGHWGRVAVLSPDEAPEVSVGPSQGWVAKPSCVKVPGAGSPDEALDVSLEH